MPTVHFRTPEGHVIDVAARAGRSLMRSAIDAGIDGIAADCGGCLTCATCHVIVDQVWFERLPPPAHDEQSMLEMTAAERQPTSRLSCQIVVDASLDGLTVTLPPTQY